MCQASMSLASLPLRLSPPLPLPSLITVFSAPNYCDQMGNKGAFIRFNGKDMVSKQMGSLGDEPREEHNWGACHM